MTEGTENNPRATPCDPVAHRGGGSWGEEGQVEQARGRECLRQVCPGGRGSQRRSDQHGEPHEVSGHQLVSGGPGTGGKPAGCPRLLRKGDRAALSPPRTWRAPCTVCPPPCTPGALPAPSLHAFLSFSPLPHCPHDTPELSRLTCTLNRDDTIVLSRVQWL